ncbi:MAG: multidrug effflux MFS transporter [Reyranellaceae bacterium]
MDRPPTKHIVALLLAIVPFSQIPLDAYTPALPQMARDLVADNAAVQNTVTAYMLGMSLALVPLGLLSDSRGRRPVLFGGMALLVAMSVGCASAGDIRTMLVMRFLQGIGGCTCLVIAYAIAADCFRDRELTSVSGLLGAAWGLAPVLAPAAGGFLVEFVSWRVVFLMIAGLAAIVMLAAFVLLPETLERERRTPVDLGHTAALVRGALTDRRFVAFTLVFAAMASAQMVFGVVAPFLYQEQLGFSAAAYGAFALLLGGVNLLGELACSGLAQRVAPRTLAFGAFAFYAAGAVCLAASGVLIGTGVISLTLAGALVLAGCGTLCPMMYGMALGLFDRNLGLIGGLISAVCYLFVSGAMAIAAVLPESSQAPLGGLYVALGLVPLVLLPSVLRRAAPVSASTRETKAS